MNKDNEKDDRPTLCKKKSLEHFLIEFMKLKTTRKK